MKKELRKHLQKYCDVSNWSRMKKPKAGKANYEAGKALAEDVLRLLMRNEPGYDGTAIMLTALALVRAYVRKAVCYSNAYSCTEDFHLLERYEDLFKSEWWTKLRDDRIMNEISYYIRGGACPYSDVLHTFDMFGNRISYSLDK